MKKRLPLIAEIIFLLTMFFVSQLPLRDFDIWFHLKSGELFLNQKALQLTEVFSYAAEGREWTTFEWLFQVIAYLISKIGLWAIPPFISIFVVIEYFFFMRILGYIFGLPLFARLLLTFVFWVSTYEFNTARPHTIAYAFLTMVLFLILARIFKNKKWIYVTPLITLVWTNVHSTGFLSWGFHLIFGLILLTQYFIQKEGKLLDTARDLFILVFINFLITLTPPMGILDYKLLWRFFQEREFLGVFIAEWSTPQDNPFGFRVYTTLVVVSLLIFLIVTIKKRLLIKHLVGIPFIIMAIGGYSATRNVFFGVLGAILLFGWALRCLLDEIRVPYKTLFWGVLSTSVIGVFMWIIALKYYDIHQNRLYYPLQASEFLKTHLRGNMFNDYNYGAYMLYQLYPQKQVFIDGRADVYLCCEMRDYLMLSVNKRMADDDYRAFLKSFFDKYDMSYAVIVTTKHNVMRRIATLLNSDPQWTLIFWDDDSQIFVRRDGKNDQVIEKFEATYATPYLRNPYVKGKMNEALSEYERMEKIAKSARTANAIGFILLQKGEFEKAQQRFKEAISLDPIFESPYMNLAELAARDGNLQKAIDLYYQAFRRAPDRGLIYIRLGQLTLDESGDREKARKIWQDGLVNTIDKDAKEQLKELLSIL